MSDLVSICLLAYNHEKYICDSLRSILEQNYPALELIILNDASSDDTDTIVKKNLSELGKKLINVEYICHDKNGGCVPHNCNEMISKAHGTYIKFLSADDILPYNAIELLTNCMKHHPDCAVVHGNALLIGDEFRLGDRTDGLVKSRSDKKSGIEKELFARLMMRNDIIAPTVMIRRSAIEKYGMFDETIPYEDYEYWLRLSRNENFYYLDEIVAYYRKSQTSMTNYDDDMSAKKLKTGIRSDFLTRDKYIEFLPAEDQKRSWQYFYERTIALCLQYNCLEEAAELVRNAKSRGIEVDLSHLNMSDRYNRISKEADLLSFWVERKKEGYLEEYFKEKGISSISIYGHSRLGILLEKELRGSSIVVKYYIDKQGNVFSDDIPVKLPDDDIDDTDAMVVAPLDIYDEIYSRYSDSYGGSILNIEDVIGVELR